MIAYLFASLLALPIYPLNPTVQDTVAVSNIHMTIGINGPNRVAGVSPEITLKYEWLIDHPYLVRLSAGYTNSLIDSRFYPNGTLHGFTIVSEIMAYRGSNKLMAFVGTGPMLSLGVLNLTSRATDSLKNEHNITQVMFKPNFGYRLSFGLRYHRVYSLEISMSRYKANFLYRQTFSNGTLAEYYDDAKISDVRITIGYLFNAGKL